MHLDWPTEWTSKGNQPVGGGENEWTGSGGSSMGLIRCLRSIEVLMKERFEAASQNSYPHVFQWE